MDNLGNMKNHEEAEDKFWFLIFYKLISSTVSCTILGITLILPGFPIFLS